jgi:L-lactate dehydrogenase complex protein LldG
MAKLPAKQNILNKIKQALSNPVPLPFPSADGHSDHFPPPNDDLEMIFAQEFGRLQGKFSFCINEKDLELQLRELIVQKNWESIYCLDEKWSAITGNSGQLANCDAAITGCEMLVARTGTIVMSAAQPAGRTVSVYAPVHICIAYTHQLVFDLKDALESLSRRYGESLPSLFSFATGPSRTADIEKTLVTGVHGTQRSLSLPGRQPMNHH